MKHILIFILTTSFSLFTFANPPAPRPDIPYSGQTPPSYKPDTHLRKNLCANYADVSIDAAFLPHPQAKELLHTYEAALRHDPIAQAKLGDQYIDGDVLPQSWQQGICWYRAAAEHGSAYAQYWLGIFYQTGALVPQDAHTASVWFSRANKHSNSPQAEYEVAARFADRRTDVFDMNQALYWYERAAQKHNVNAELALGDFYITSHTDSDIRRALSWYGKAAGSGSLRAEYSIGQVYYHGEGIDKDFKEAHDWFMKAATRGYAPAQYDLAQMYYQGQGMKRDNYKAYAWLVTSNAAQRNPEAALVQESLTKEFTPEELRIASQMANDYKARYR